ncbi:MAG TPA: protease modulator HflC [Verrucomicrobiae bacterium]|jgi:membrane protease subunit HflC|nr:protease modulator HflC [Verrucomicrobiae bacterium]
MKKNLLTLVIGAVLVIIFALLIFSFQVRQSEVVVVTTFLKPTRSIDQPGFYFKWPWPIQQVNRFDKRIQNFEDKFRQTLTKDNNNLIVTVYTGWQISDAGQFMKVFPGGSVSAAQRALEGLLGNAKQGVIASHNLSDFVNSDPQQLKFDEIEGEIKAAAQSQLSTNNYGIQLDFLGFKKIELPETVTATVFARMTAERQQLISRLQSDGDKQASDIKSAADRQASGVINNAIADAVRIRGEGEAAAASTYKNFQQNPELANFLAGIDALPKLLNQHATLIFDERMPPFDLFQNLPTNSPSH